MLNLVFGGRHILYFKGFGFFQSHFNTQQSRLDGRLQFFKPKKPVIVCSSDCQGHPGKLDTCKFLRRFAAVLYIFIIAAPLDPHPCVRHWTASPSFSAPARL